MFLYRLIYNSLPLLLPPPSESAPQTNDAGPARHRRSRLIRDLEWVRMELAKCVWARARAQGLFSLIAGAISGGVAIRSVDAGLRSGMAQQGFVRSVP